VFSSSLAEETTFEEVEEMGPPTRVFVHNEKLAPFPYEKTEDFLLEGKRGAYTTARSVGQDAVFEFEAHVERLVESSLLMMESDKEAGGGECLRKHKDALCFTRLRPKVLASLKMGMQAFREQQQQQQAEEMKLTLLLTWDAETMDISTVVTPLGERPAQPVKVQIGGKPRQNALAKDSAWTRQRRELEDARPKDCNEVILMDDDGHLFEGLQTNFYVLKDGKLHTAGKGILEGTVRKMLLEECVKEGFPVCLNAPNIVDMDQWQGVFISSTSRLLLPVSEVVYSDKSSGKILKKSFAPLDPLVTRLEQLVLDRYRQESTTIV
jgi:thiol oxidase